MVGWKNTETFLFIELYQNEPCIWNPKHKLHKDKIKVNDAWLRIANAMGVPMAEIKKKKETLLSAFRLNHKKVVASRKSGAGEDEIFKPIWIYYDVLATFVSDVYECKSILTSEDHDQDEESVEGVPSPSVSSSNVPQVSDELSHGEKRENAAQTTPRISIPVQKRRSHKPLELQETNTQVKNALSTLNNVLSANKKQPCEDDCDLYGRLRATKLRQYTELDRQDLMYEILVDGMLLKKRWSLDSRSSSYHKRHVSSPSEIIISGRPSTSHSAHSNHSTYIVDHHQSSPTDTSTPSPSYAFTHHQPSSTDTSTPSPSYAFTHHQPSPTYTSVSSSPQVFITNHTSFANNTQLLRILDESHGSYHHRHRLSALMIF